MLTKYEIYDIINNVEVLQKIEECTYSSSYYGNPETIKGYISKFEGRRLIRLSKPDINEDIQYTYNAWGEVVSEGGSNIIHQINILMYKGYVYDRETKFYYCQSRYYNPQWCRWINADDIYHL